MIQKDLHTVVSFSLTSAVVTIIAWYSVWIKILQNAMYFLSYSLSLPALNRQIHHSYLCTSYLTGLVTKLKCSELNCHTHTVSVSFHFHSGFYNIPKRPRNTFLSHDKYHTDLITAKESNCKNKVPHGKTCYMVYNLTV